MINIGIIGYGNWGPGLVRNFVGNDSCIVRKVADRRTGRLRALGGDHPSVVAVQNNNDILNDPKIDAVVISTPLFTHYEIARKALENGKHVLVEKPMTATTEQALRLIDIAGRKQKILMVDHTLLYSGAVRKIKEIIDNGEIGNLKYFDSTRMNLGMFQPDVNVLWDLAAHDISIINHLIAERPCSINSTGVSHTGNGIENIGYMTLKYSSGLIAHFSCSWISPVKIRQTLIGGDKKMISFNDLEPLEKVKIYDCGYNFASGNENQYEISVDYRRGDTHIPEIDQTEPLSLVVRDFIGAIMRNTSPVSDFRSGLEVMQILEASDVSIKNGGREVILETRPGYVVGSPVLKPASSK
jgi:predicted dehydrogenase